MIIITKLVASINCERDAAKVYLAPVALKASANYSEDLPVPRWSAANCFVAT